MGNKLSISCCSSSCISCRSPSSCRKKDRSRRQIQRGPEELSEHPKAPDSPTCDASAPNDGSPRDTSDLRTQLNVDEERERIQQEITKELKLKHGAEKLRKIIKDEKHLAAVDDFLKKSEEKLEELYNSIPPISELDVIIETEEPSSSSDAIAKDLEVSLVEDVAAAAADFYKDFESFVLNDDDIPCSDLFNNLQLIIMENIDAQEDDEAEDLDVSIIGKVDTPEDVVFGDLQSSIMENNDAPVKDLGVSVTANEALSLDDVTDVPDVSIMENIPATENEALAHLPSFQPHHPLSLQDFSCCSLLGRGGFGKVLLAEHKTTRKMFAIKAIKKAGIVEADGIQSLMYEKHIFQAASRGQHPFLVNLFRSFQNIDHVFFVMEFAAGGDLTTHINNDWGVFSISRATFYAACVTLGLEYLHENKIVHRDLKLANVVLDQEGFAKITDFGNGKEGMGFGDRTDTFCGTLDHMAPEIFTQPSYTRSVDWWSFGVMIYVMLFGKTPFPGNDEDELETNIISYNIQYAVHMPVRATRILQSLLNRNPEKRLGAGENGTQDVKEHLFFMEIDWSELLSRKMKPPFVPTLQGPRDTSHFDRRVTFEAPDLTPQHESLTEKEQEGFRDFDWVADWAE